MARTFNTNQTPATSAIAMYNLKALLIAAGWVTKASGDGTTLFAATDGITSGNAGAGGLGNSRAWFRIQDPAGLRELCFQRGSSTNQTWWIKYSAVSKFTGGAQSATTMPTAADEQNVWGTTTAGTQLFTGTEAAMRFHCMAENSAPYTFYIYAYSTGGSVGKGLFMMDSLQSGSYDVLDDDPVVFYGSSAGSDLFSASNTGIVFHVNNNSDQRGVWGWIKHGLAGAGWVNMGFAVIMINSAMGLPGSIASNQYTGKDEVFPPYIMRIGNGAVAAPFGYRGVPNQIRMIGTKRSNSGDTISLVTTRDYIILDQVWALPWDGSVPLN
jgi:hypothetical protein